MDEILSTDELTQIYNEYIFLKKEKLVDINKKIILINNRRIPLLSKHYAVNKEYRLYLESQINDVSNNQNPIYHIRDSEDNFEKSLYAEIIPIELLFGKIINFLTDKSNVESNKLKREYIVNEKGYYENELSYCKLEIEKNEFETRIYEISKILITASYMVGIDSCVKIGYLLNNEEDELIVKESYDGLKRGTLIDELKYIPSPGEVSNKSPIGMALLDRKKGDVVTVHSPRSKYDIQILKICWIKS